ncbi:hypothetical protein MRB53_015637 [Persea americana]|uniref:Uncharacterized protein n=1 Tax=Persea americana TaxID=3435 RepID=A0ACC2M0H7_PERAE|nr:hypothetical protein MRB53_015637 [Persea americana]
MRLSGFDERSTIRSAAAFAEGETELDCPFCNHGSSVECRIDMKNLIGEATCRICQENFSTTITALSEPIDIYSEWIDECERVNNLEDEATEA